MMKFNHPFHMVTNSPWPILNSFSLLNLIFSMIFLIYLNKFFWFILNLIIMSLMMFQWWKDVIRESTFQGFHTYMILKMLKFSMILFIISELFFFISLFWTFFHNSISPSIEIGLMWPPKNIIMFNPYNIPLLNSLILIFSGMLLTWSHQCLLNKKFYSTKQLLMYSFSLGMYFSLIQYYEYKTSFYSINDSIFGSIFYMLTGFHGIHMIIGIIFLMTCFYRLKKFHFSNIHHFHFEAASWYWHFIDVIWLLLYIFIYWWMY